MFRRNGDGGTFTIWCLGIAIHCKILPLLLPRDIPDLGTVAFVIVSENVFPLKKNIMRPHSGKTSEE